MQTRVIILLISAVLIIMFAVVNIEPVTVDFIFFEAEIKLIFVIIFSILFGSLFMYILSTLSHIRLNKKIKNLEKGNNIDKKKTKDKDKKLKKHDNIKTENTEIKIENTEIKEEVKEEIIENEKKEQNIDEEKKDK